MEKFSVLISVYHRERGEFLRAALESVFDQTILPNQVILVEDGPLTEELYGVIEAFKNAHQTLQVVSLPENVGLGDALNQGLAHCTYDLVARMDSDDICVRDRFEKQLRIFTKRPDLTVVGSWVDEFSTTPSSIRAIRKLPECHSDIALFARSKCPVNHPSVMFRKTDVLAVSGYASFYLFEDYFLWARLLNAGYKFHNISESLVLMRTGDGLFARRGGWRYALSEIRLQKQFLKMGFIGRLTFIKNVAVRFSVRMMPNKIRTFVYMKLLRSK